MVIAAKSLDSDGRTFAVLCVIGDQVNADQIHAYASLSQNGRHDGIFSVLMLCNNRWGEERSGKVA